MRNYFIGIIFLVILPASFSSSDSTGCNKQKSECTEKQSENKKESDKEKNKPECKGQKSAETEIVCFSILRIE